MRGYLIADCEEQAVLATLLTRPLPTIPLWLGINMSEVDVVGVYEYLK